MPKYLHQVIIHPEDLSNIVNLQPTQAVLDFGYDDYMNQIPAPAIGAKRVAVMLTEKGEWFNKVITGVDYRVLTVTEYTHVKAVNLGDKRSISPSIMNSNSRYPIYTDSEGLAYIPGGNSIFGREGEYLLYGRHNTLSSCAVLKVVKNGEVIGEAVEVQAVDFNWYQNEFKNIAMVLFPEVFQEIDHAHMDYAYNLPLYIDEPAVDIEAILKQKAPELAGKSSGVKGFKRRGLKSYFLERPTIRPNVVGWQDVTAILDTELS